jgi:hypothetical protein
MNRCLPCTAAAEEIGIYMIEAFVVVCKISVSCAGCKDKPKETAGEMKLV